MNVASLQISSGLANGEAVSDGKCSDCAEPQLLEGFVSEATDAE